MKYIGIKEAARKWGISDRRVRLLCQEGKIDGAIKLEWSWTIPADTPKPFDGRQMRHYKNHDLRLGSIDITTLNILKDKCPLDKSMILSDEFSSLIPGALELALSLTGRSYDHNRIIAVFSGKLVPSISLEEHLLYTNFRSVIRDCVMNPRELDSRRFIEIHHSLAQGINDYQAGVVREGTSETALRGKESLEVSLQLETLFRQNELEWKSLHPVFRAVILYCEIMRIKPFELLNEEFALLILLSVLLGSGYTIPQLEGSEAAELNAATSIAFRRGNYQDVARFFEQALISAYQGVFHV